MSIHAFHRDLPVPPGANHLCQAECVIRVGFVDLKAERSLGVAGVHADNRHAASTQAEREPVGELPGLQTDPHRAWRMLAHDCGNRVGVGTALPAPDDGAGIVDDANGGRLERNVEADIMALLIHAFLRVTRLTPQSLPAAPGQQPTLCDYAMSRRLRSGSRSARKGSRDRNASTAWRLAA